MLKFNLDLNIDAFNLPGLDKKVFVSSQVLDRLQSSRMAIHRQLIQGVDKIVIQKDNNPVFFKQLNNLHLLDHRAGSVTLLFDSGVVKLLISSKKAIGIKFRNWVIDHLLSINIASEFNTDNHSLNISFEVDSGINNKDEEDLKWLLD